ncbi:MAG: mycofactocin system GMC family oxidoreductase MftG [Mycobacterium sp.]
MTLRPHSDVLIVGAGSAGSVLAERLSADPSCAVRVIEAGPGPVHPGWQEMTANGYQLPIGAASPLVARFQTVLTDHPQRTVQLVRGATVGGSGAVNGGYFCRGLPRDFDGWALPGWAWRDVLPHFRAIETDLDFRGPGHGDRGPIPVRRTHEMVGSTALFRDVAERAGFGWLPDLNGDQVGAGMPTGVGAVPLNIVAGVRRGPGATFLAPALARSNLDLVAGARAMRIRIDAGRATGVDVLGSDGIETLTADRIVLSAGAIGSAHLLMLSGVGDEPTLRAAGVPVLLAAPVGVHCTDHPEWVLPTNWAVAPARPVVEIALSTADDLEIRPYTGGFVAMVGDGTAGHPDWPHIGVALMQPRARSRIALVSADPLIPPSIEHHYDSEPADVAALQAGADLVSEMTRGATDFGDPAWSTSQHLCGSAPMGRDGDAAAVLDPQCRVRGVDGLWVVDGAALPGIPSRGPHATTVMLAHRAAEFLSAG